MNPRAFSPEDGFYLGFWPAELAVGPVNQTLLTIEKDPSDEKLTHALSRVQKRLAIFRTWESDTWKQLETRSGLTLPPLPKSAAEASSWLGKVRALLHDAVQAAGNASALSAFAVGVITGDLYAAVKQGRALRHLGAAAPNHPIVKKQAADAARIIAEDEPKLAAALRNPTWNTALAAHLTKLSNLFAQTPDLVAANTFEALEAWEKWGEAVDGALTDIGPLIAIPSETPVKSPPIAEEQALFAEVLAHPQDNAPRKRFAELAAARNDPRAELIREQLAVVEKAARGELESVLITHRQRAAQILKLHPDWQLPAELSRLGVKSARHHRGFIGEVVIDARDFLANAEALYAAAPIEHLILRSAAGHIAELAASPHLDRIRSLILRENGLGDADAQALAASSHLGKLEYLNLSDNQIGNAGVEAIVASARLPALVRLYVSQNAGDEPAELFDLDETNRVFAPTEFGKRLEAKYGKKPYFHEPGPWPQDIIEVEGR